MPQGRLRAWASESSVIYHAVEGRPEPRAPLLALRKAAIYQQHPKALGPDGASKPIFSNLSFSLDSDRDSPERWAVISHGDSIIRTKFLQTLRGQYTCLPPTGRVWPYLASDEYAKRRKVSREPSRAIQYVGFSNQGAGVGSTGTQGAYLGSRYESRKETTDWSLLDYLRGTVSLNLSEDEVQQAELLQKNPVFSKTIQDFKLEDLLSLPVGNLSNGQTRRARIAKSVLGKPEVLLLDEPFAGLDPVNSQVLSGLLSSLADTSEPRMVLALPPAEVPAWITHVVHLEQNGDIQAIGEKEQVYRADTQLVYMTHIYPKPLKRNYRFQDPEKELKRQELLEKTGGMVQKHEARLHKYWPDKDQRAFIFARQPDFPFWNSLEPPVQTEDVAKPLVEMDGVRVKYGDKCVLGDWTQIVDGEQKSGLHWEVKAGERWGVFGPNGSGKTTLISLLTSDHPQAYSLPMKIFGRSRLPSPGQPGISVFDLQSRIGHSSPEVHTFFPKHFNIRQTIESAWAEAFHSKPVLTWKDDEKVDHVLRWFRKELDPSLATEPDPLDHFFRIKLNHIALMRNLKRKGTGRGHVKRGHVPHFEQWYEDESRWADRIKFSELSLSAQRVALFIRAVIKKPDIVVLDEAFSGMDELSRRKCLMWLAHGDLKWLQAPYQWSVMQEPKIDTGLDGVGLSRISGLEPRQALICISHREEELPFVVDNWLRLPEANEGKPVVFGKIDKSQRDWWLRDWWSEIWTKEP